MSDRKQFNYQWRCSFLEVIEFEFFIKLSNAAMSLFLSVANFILFFAVFAKQIYDEQIRNLLNPIQRNLEVGICCHSLWYNLLSKALFSSFYYFSFCVLIIIMAWSKLSQVKEDSKNALYIENLIEEYVTGYDDVAQILIKVAIKGIYILLKVTCLFYNKINA